MSLRQDNIPYRLNCRPESTIRLSSGPWRVGTAPVRREEVLNILGHRLASFLCKRPDSKYVGFVGQEEKLKLLCRTY